MIAQILKQQRRHALLLFFALLLAPVLALPASAQGYREEVRVPMAEAGERGLQALFIRPNAPGRYPLAVFSHGAPRDTEQRRRMSPYQSLPVAMEFVRRGYAVAIVMRRGYGTSGGNYAEGVACERDGNFTASGQIAAADIRAAFEFFGRRNDVDANVMIAVGESAGGFSSLALSANPPRGLVAVISFAGGRGSTGPFQICQEDKLVQAFANYGRTSRVPTLWIYAENDTFFAPKVVRTFYEAFTRAGGNANLIAHPAHGEDGHNFVYRGLDVWPAYVDDFLRKNKLPRSQTLAQVQIPNLPPPPRLTENGLNHFRDYLRAGPNKAFAVSSDGAFGWQSGMNSREDAIERALRRCAEHAKDCRVYAVNDEIAKDAPRTQQPPARTSNIPPPPRLDQNGLRAFDDFLRARPHKAFAVTPDGAYGWRTGAASREEAIKDALATCEKYGKGCRLYLVNDEIATERQAPVAPQRQEPITPPRQEPITPPNNSDAPPGASQ